MDSFRRCARPRTLVKNPSTKATYVSINVRGPFGVYATISTRPQAEITVQLLLAFYFSPS